MNSAILLLFGLLVFGLGYWLYAKKIESLFGIDPHRPTPSKTNYDGIDFVPARNWLVLFGHHFASIAGAGPIIGPVVACVYWGWFPALLWILFGTILIGGVHDFASLIISVREGAKSIPEISKVAISAKAKFIFSIFVWLALILVISVFADLCAKTFVTEPRIILPSLGLIPVAMLFGFFVYVKKFNFAFSTILALGLLVTLLFLGQVFPIKFSGQTNLIWIYILLVYCFVASTIPVHILLQPRDYLSSFLLFFGLLAGLLGVFISRPMVTQPAFVAWNTKEGVLWPMMFVTVACGAISGFHSLIAGGTTSKQIPNERYVRRIGYGAMVAEGLVALLAILAVVSGISTKGISACSLLSESGPICVFGEGFSGLTRVILGHYGMFVAITILNAFILTTLDTATRVCRYITEELTGISNRFVSTLIVVVLAAILALSGAWNKIWPVFGASNQLVAALALLVATCWLLARGKPTRYTLIPAIFMFITTLMALFMQFFTYIKDRNYLLMLITLVLIILALVMLDESRRIFKLKLKG